MPSAASTNDPEYVGSKRTSADSPDNGPKNKRSRYVSNACNECKRRKVRCSGEEPCQRCVNSMIQCSYHRPPRYDGTSSAHSNGIGDQHFQQLPDPRSDELLQMNMQIHAVMEKVNSLNDKLTTLFPSGATDSNRPPLANILEQSQLNLATDAGARRCSIQPSIITGTETISPEYHGPTSSEFTFRVANDSLTELGVECAVSAMAQSNHNLSSQNISRIPATDKLVLKRLLTRDPLWHIKQSDAIAYMERYRDSLAAMYPVFDDQYLLEKTRLLFDALDEARGGSYGEGLGHLIELLFSNDVHIIKIVIGIGLINDARAPRSETALQLMQSVLDSSEDSLMNAEGLGGVQLLVLTALFHLNLDEELKASRYICLASRRCLEMGLHRRDMVVKHFSEDSVQRAALRIFWSVFTLDRRSSLGLGVPFVIQDSLVDPALIAMDFDHAYLRTMIPFTKLSGKAWQMSNDYGIKDGDAISQEVDYLDYQVLQWQKRIPNSIRYCPGSRSTQILAGGDLDSRQRFFVSVVLQVRSNQLRNVIYRPLLQSTLCIKSHTEHVQTALDIAKESLQVLLDLDLDPGTDLLETHATFFKHFIVSALGNLLLIALHATTEYWSSLRETFYKALALLRRLSKWSRPVMRMWDRLKGLEDLQAKITHARRENENWDPSSLGRGLKTAAEVGGNESSDLATTLGNGGDYMLFDSQIRDEFAGFFDSSFDVSDFFDFPLPEATGAT